MSDQAGSLRTSIGIIATAVWFLVVFYVTRLIAPLVATPVAWGLFGTSLLLILATGPMEYIAGTWDFDAISPWVVLFSVAVLALMANVYFTGAGQPALASLGLLVGVVIAGVLIGRYALLDRDLLLIITVLYIIVDIYSVFFGPTQVIIEQGGPALRMLTVRFPILSTSQVASLVGASDFLVWAACLQAAHRFGFNYRASFAALSGGLLASAVVGVVAQRAIPALPLMMLAYLLVNARHFDWRKRSLWTMAGGLLAVVLVFGAVARWWLLR